MRESYDKIHIESMQTPDIGGKGIPVGQAYSRLLFYMGCISPVTEVQKSYPYPFGVKEIRHFTHFPIYIECSFIAFKPPVKYMIVGSQKDIDTAVGKILCIGVRSTEGGIAGVGFASKRKFKIGHGNIRLREQGTYGLEESRTIVVELCLVHHDIPHKHQ